MAGLTPYKAQFFDAAGDPLVGGKLYSYVAGTTTPRQTFTDSTGATPNANPVILNARGEADVWLLNESYKMRLDDASDVTIWTIDNISIPGFQTYQSADGLFSWVNTGTQLQIFAPAISTLPKNVRWVLRCITSGDGNFLPGHYIDITHSSVGTSGYQIVAGVTTFYYSQNGALAVKDKSTGAASITLTAAKWDLKCIVDA